MMIESDKRPFMNLVALVGENYNSQFTNAKVQLWWDLLKQYDFNDVSRSIYEHLANSSFEPKPADLIKRMLPDFEQMYLRMINKTPKNDLEARVFSACRYDCVRAKEERAIQKLKAEYQRQEKMPPPNVQAARIEHKRIKSPLEIEIEENAKKYKGKDRFEIQREIDNLKHKKSACFKSIEKPKKSWTVCLECQKVGECIKAKRCLDGRH